MCVVIVVAAATATATSTMTAVGVRKRHITRHIRVRSQNEMVRRKTGTNTRVQNENAIRCNE